jgi:hypothetical protein
MIGVLLKFEILPSSLCPVLPLYYVLHSSVPLAHNLSILCSFVLPSLYPSSLQNCVSWQLHLLSLPPLLIVIRKTLYTTAPETDEVETIESLLALLKPGGLSKTESMAASIPILKFVSGLLEKEDVLERVPREIIVLFCEIAVERLPLAVVHMKEPLFDSEFMNDTCKLASQIDL